ncbi:hypothetical protein HK096_007817, partial [Nowakowskiella sp. JEL0078]
MTAALRNPTLFKSLIVVDIPPTHKGLGRSFKTYIDAMHEIEKLKVKNLTDAHEVLNRFGVTELAVRQFLLTNHKWDDEK